MCATGYQKNLMSTYYNYSLRKRKEKEKSLAGSVNSLFRGKAKPKLLVHEAGETTVYPYLLPSWQQKGPQHMWVRVCAQQGELWFAEKFRRFIITTSDWFSKRGGVVCALTRVRRAVRSGYIIISCRDETPGCSQHLPAICLWLWLLDWECSTDHLS